MLTATTRLHIYWHWYRGRLLVAALLHAAVVLLCYEEYRQIRHPTLQISGMHYFVIVAIALIAWCMSREYVGALSQESSALAPAALDQLPYLHEGTISTRVAALVQIIVLGLFVCCGTVVIAFREWLSESWPTTTAIVESKDFRNGGVRVMFTLQIDGQSPCRSYSDWLGGVIALCFR